jgi:uncharacterized protein YaeQ
MMLRLLAFAMHADEGLVFTRGLSTDDEPDLWQMDLTGEVKLWIELGTLDEKRIRRACGRAKRVVICGGPESLDRIFPGLSGSLRVMRPD